MSQENKDENNGVSYSECTYSYSSSSAVGDGKVVTESWKGGFGHETTGNKTRYFAFSPESSSQQYKQVSQEEYDKIQQNIRTKIGKNKRILC